MSTGEDKDGKMLVRGGEEVIRKRNEDNGEETEIHQYAFYDLQSRDLFAASRMSAVHLEHPSLSFYHSGVSHDEGKVYYFSLETESCQWTLDSLTLEKLKSGGFWSVEEVKILLKDISAGVAYAETQVRSSQGLFCSDFQGSNIQCSSSGFKIRSYHDRSGLDFTALRPEYMSPELRSAYSKWVLGLPQESDEVDFGKSAVYSLGLLVVFALNPDLKAYVSPHERLISRIQSSKMPSNLTQMILQMLTKDPDSRPHPRAISSLIDTFFPPENSEFLSFLTASLASNSVSDASFYLTKLIETDLSVSITFPCSLCGGEISLFPKIQKSISQCGKHLICGISCLVQAANTYGYGQETECPACAKEVPQVRSRKKLVLVKQKPQESKPEESKVEKPTTDLMRTCEKCKREFLYDSSESWRLQLLGSSSYATVQSFCSEKCMTPTAPIRTQEISSSRPQGFQNPIDSWSSYSEESEDTEDSLLLEIYPMKMAFNLLEKREETYGVQSSAADRRKFDYTALSMTQELVYKYNGDISCHFCSNVLEDITFGRWIICGRMPRFICSPECILRCLQVTDHMERYPDRQCPMCGKTVFGEYIGETINFKSYFDVPKSKKCLGCFGRGVTALECGHMYCQSCFNQTGGESWTCPKCLVTNSLVTGFMSRLGFR